MAAKRPAKVPAAPTVGIETVPLSAIDLGVGIQPRGETSGEVVADYADAIRDGATFPPVVLFRDGEVLRLVDGWHRVTASRDAGLVEIVAEIHDGDLDAATLYAVGANATHGLRRTNAQKRHAVTMALARWPNDADRDIARKCGVDHKTVSAARASLGNFPSEAERRTYTTKHGTVATMDVSRIGKKPEPAALPLLSVEPAAPPSPSPSLVPSPAEEPAPEETGNVIHLGARLERMPTERELEREAEAEQAKQEVLDEDDEGFDETNPTSRARVVFHAINLINGVRLQSGDYWGYFKFGPHGPSFVADAKFARETLDLLIHEYEANERRRK